MTIEDVMAKLQNIKNKYGDVQVYFDCPKCGISCAPNTIAIVAVHLSEEKEND